MSLKFASSKFQALSVLYFTHILRAQHRRYATGIGQGEGSTRGDKLIPTEHWAASAYHWFSTMMHVINLTLIAGIKWGLLERYGTVRCFWMPMLAVHASVPLEIMMLVSALFSLLHIVWRLLMLFTSHKHGIEVFAFLLGDQFQKSAQLRAPPGTILKRVDRRFALNEFELHHHSQEDSISKTVLSPAESILYYKHSTLRCQQPNQPFPITIRYELRPNRTLEAHRELISTLATYSKLIVGAFALLFLLLAPLGFHVMLMRHDYLYFNCPQVAPINSWLLLSASLYWRRAVGSMLLSTIMFVDCIGAVMFISTLTVVVTEDLFICWRAIHLKARRLVCLLKCWAQASSSLHGSTLQVSEQHSWSGTHEKGRKSEGATNHLVYSHSSEGRNEVIGSRLIQLHAFEQLVGRHYTTLEASFQDFSLQLQRADGFVSILLTTGLIIWFSINLLITIQGVQLMSSTRLFAIRLFQVGIMVSFSVAAFYILSLKTEVESGYPLLCSLTALDPERHKRRWLALMDIYEGPRRLYSFTFWLTSGQLLTKQTYCKILSYTVSLMFFYETYRSNRVVL